MIGMFTQTHMIVNAKHKNVIYMNMKTISAYRGTLPVTNEKMVKCWFRYLNYQRIQLTLITRVITGNTG